MTVADTARIGQASDLVGAVARLDVSGLSEQDFLGAYEAAARLGRLTDALRARFAGDAARRSSPDQAGGGLARRQGFGNAASMVAAVTGGSQAGAWRAIEAAGALTTKLPLAHDLSDPGEVSDNHPGPEDRSDLREPADDDPVHRFPALADALLSGKLSTDAAALVTAGLQSMGDRVPSDQLHELERRLVAKAKNLKVQDVRRLVAHAVARADLAGHVEREKRQHADRYLSWSEDHTGMVTLNGRLDAVTAAPIRTVIEQLVTHQFRQRRDQDPLEQDQRSVGQLRADALYDLARHALGCKETTNSGVRTTIIVRMNLSDLNTGEGLGRIDGTHQPVSVGELRRLAGEVGVIPQVLGGPSEVLDQGCEVRMFTRAQRLALLERDGGCAKCHAPPEHCEAHHIVWWKHGGGTDLSNGVMLCTRCHHDIHRQRWRIRIRKGTVEFIPPPHIDPSQTPRPGGRTAITPDGDGRHSTHEPPGRETGKNSVSTITTHTEKPRENPAHNAATQEAA